LTNKETTEEILNYDQTDQTYTSIENFTLRDSSEKLKKSNHTNQNQTNLTNLNIIESSKELEFNNNSVKVIDNLNNTKFALANFVLNNKTNFNWKIQIKKMKYWTAIGVTKKNKLIKSGYKLDSSLKNDHHSFLVTSNQFSWNCNNKDQNILEFKNFNEFKAGDEIKLSYSCFTQELKITLGEKTVILNKVNIEKQDEEDEELVPCVILKYKDDEVKFEFENN